MTCPSCNQDECVCGPQVKTRAALERIAEALERQNEISEAYYKHLTRPRHIFADYDSGVADGYRKATQTCTCAPAGPTLQITGYCPLHNPNAPKPGKVDLDDG